MRRVYLIHRNADEAARLAAKLQLAGYQVDCTPFDQDVWRALRKDAPDAVVIDLSRLPSHGRDVAMALREAKSTRHVPLVFVEGDADKLERIRAQLPDAVFTTWRRIRGSLRRAIENPPADPVSLQDLFGGRHLVGA